MPTSAKSRDFIYEIVVPGGTEVTIENASVLVDGTIYADSNLPPNNDPRFPALYRTPPGQIAQIDILAVYPVLPEDADVILTEAGLAITGEAPTSALRT
jgi:hypothetical protein